MSQASEATKLYRFEREYIDKRYEGHKSDWSIQFLRQIANNIWNNEAPKGWGIPKILASKGMRCGGSWVSWCVGRSFIELAPGQRFPAVIVHELAHALRNGNQAHNKQFCRRYFDLLVKYLGYDKTELYNAAKSAGVKC